jgi:hypothetical protein
MKVIGQDDNRINGKRVALQTVAKCCPQVIDVFD